MKIDMGYWRCDRQLRTKQLLMYLKRLTGEFADSYMAETGSGKKGAGGGGDDGDAKESDASDDDDDEDEDESAEEAYKSEAGITSLFISNALFIDTVFDLTTGFRKNFKAYIRHAKFFDESLHREVGQAIDGWADRHTCGKAKPIADMLRLTEASSIGVSTLYFHGQFTYKWEMIRGYLPFYSDPAHSAELKEVAYMRSDYRRVLYHKTDDEKFTVIGMDYALSSKNALNRLSLVLVKRNDIRSREHVGRKPIKLCVCVCLLCWFGMY